tara:strand:+ start:124 stop:1146 length:1023 start_codon:yes stop_codon:yes gene_type:complete
MANISYLIITLLSIYILYIFNKFSLKIGKKLNVLDIPSKTKIHKNITPLTGSYGLVAISLLLFLYLNFYFSTNNLNFVFLYSYLFFLLGFFDDKYNLNAYLKLLSSCIFLVLILLIFNELLLYKVFSEILGKEIIFKFPLNYIITILCILLLINAVNLIDGINGLASMFISLWIFFISLVSQSNVSTIILIFSLFILINTYFIYKGKYFLGDAGTLFFGSLVSLLTIYFYNFNLLNGKVISIEKIFIFFMIPGIDMFRLFLARILNSKDPFSRDLDHLHHLLGKFFSLEKSLLIYFLLFLTTNLASHFNILKPVYIILIYTTFYIFFIFFAKKKFKNPSH